MIQLASTSDLLQLVTGGTQVIKVHASYADMSGITITYARLNTSISTVTTTTIVGSPAASTQRRVMFLSILNSDTTTPNTITLQVFATGTTCVLQQIALLPGAVLNYSSVGGFAITPQR